MSLIDLFASAAVAGIPLVAFVLGLVQWIKGLGLQGLAVRILSLAVGVVFGTGYQVSVKIPTSFAEWFATIVFGLTLGLVASGLYDVNKEAKNLA